MAIPQGAWGIDIGQCALKALRLQMIDGKVTATAFDYIEHPKILSQPDADPDQLTREALETFLSRNNIKNDIVGIAVPGQSGLARFVKLPPVEQKKISEIVRFEAKQQIPFPLEEVVWDYQQIGEGIVTDGFAMETEIGLFAMKREMISRFINHFQGVGVEVNVIQMAPLALCNYVAYDLLKKGIPKEEGAEEENENPGKRRCAVALDIGTDNSNLIITDGEKIIWQRPIPLGGNHFTRALTKELKLTFAKAEHLKRNAAKSPELANILKALRPVLTEFVGEVQRSLGYFTNTHRDAFIAYMVGLGSAFRLPGLQKYLAEKLQLEVKKPNKFEEMVGESVMSSPVFLENILTFPVTYGLALQGLEISRLKTNLLPPEIATDRKIRAKKPLAVASAAMMLLGMTVMAWGYSGPYAALQDPNIDKAISNGESKKKMSQTNDSTITSNNSKISEAKRDVKAIIAGQDEITFWIRMEEFLNRALPIPGENGNLKARRSLTYTIDGRDETRTINQERFWRTEESERAIRKYQSRLTGSEPYDPLAPPDDTRPFLPMVDIESKHCKYSTDLATFFKKATATAQQNLNLTPKALGLLPEDLATPPEGAGWVVEIRGTTTFKDGPAFLKDCLVYNLATLEREGYGLPKSETTDAAKTTPPDPLRNKIKHVLLLHYEEDQNPAPGPMRKITGSMIEGLVIAASPSASTDGTSTEGGYGNPMPPPMGRDGDSMGPPSLDGISGQTSSGGYTPLINLGTASTLGSRNPLTQNNPDSFNPMNPLNPMVTQPPTTKEEPKGTRWEFVVVLIWQEPVAAPTEAK